jgi:hypothetical protein
MSRQGQNIGRTKRTTYDPVPLGTERFVPTGRYTLLDIRIAYLIPTGSEYNRP